MIVPASLGASLYVPADRGDLLRIATGEKYPQLRSVILCAEDAVSEARIPVALESLRRLFQALEDRGGSVHQRPILFVRPRNTRMLSLICSMPGVNQVTGFVLPKITAQSLEGYLCAMRSEQHFIMPTIETREAFDPDAMKDLRSKLLLIQPRVLAIRIGGNDLLRTIGARWSHRRTIYDGPIGSTIANLVTTFVPYGFAMSSVVCNTFHDLELLREEVEIDLDYGLFTKSAIHPKQVDLIHALYKVSAEDIVAARAILDGKAPAVFSMNGALLEPATHSNWATSIIARAEIFGTLGLQTKALASV